MNASRPESFKGTIQPQSTQVIVFDLKAGKQTLISYGNREFLKAQPPQYSGDKLSEAEN